MVLRGVKAVATLLADFRMVARTSHDRFLARYQSTDETTTTTSVRVFNVRDMELTAKNADGTGNHNDCNDCPS